MGNTQTIKNNEVRVQVRMDENVKRQSENVFKKLGLTLSGGINIYLRRVAIENGIPFSLTLSREELLGNDVIETEKRVNEAIRAATDQSDGKPIARFDFDKEVPYLEYPGGRRDYDIEN